MPNNIAFVPPPQLTNDPNSNWQVEVWKGLNDNNNKPSGTPSGNITVYPGPLNKETAPIDVSLVTNFDSRPSLQAFFSYCSANGITSCTIPPGTYFITPYLDIRGISKLDIYAYGCRFVQHPASVYYMPNPDALYPGYAFNSYVPTGAVSGKPGMLLADATTVDVHFYGIDFDFNYINTDTNAFNLHFDCYQSTGLVFCDCNFRRFKSQLFLLSCVKSGFDGGSQGEMVFGSQKGFITSKAYQGSNGRNDILVKATSFKGWLQQDKRRYEIKIVSPVGGVDQFVWSLARGGYLGVYAADPTQIANSAVSSAISGGYAMAAGNISLAGLGTVPMNTWGAVAVDITTAGAVTLTSAPANTTTGYSTSDLAFAAIPALSAGLFRVGQFAVSNPSAAFVFGTNSLQSLNANFLTQCASDGPHDSFSPYGPYTTVPRPCPVGNTTWYATPDDPDALHITAPAANDPLLWDDGTTYKDFGQSYDGGQSQAHLVSTPLLSVAFVANTGHTIGDTWTFRWMDTRLAAICITGAEITTDPTTIPKRDCFYRRMDGPLGPADLYNFFINHVNGFVLDNCTSLTASTDQICNFKFSNNEVGYSEWGTCVNVQVSCNKIYGGGGDNYSGSGLCLHLFGSVQNFIISDNQFFDWGIDPNSSGSYYPRYSAIRLDSNALGLGANTYKNVQITNNTFRNERTDIFNNRVWYGIFGQSALYEDIIVKNNIYSDHVAPLGGDATFLTAAVVGLKTRQNYGYSFSGTYSLVNQDSGVNCRIDFAPPLVTSMRLELGSYLTFSGSPNVANNINYTVLSEVRNSSDAITAIIFSTSAPDPTTATFTGIVCPPQAVLFYDDDIIVNLSGATSNIYANVAYLSPSYSGQLHVIATDTTASTNNVTFVGGTFLWTAGNVGKPYVNGQFDVSLTGEAGTINCIVTSRNATIVSSLSNTNTVGSTINYDVSQVTSLYCYGQLSSAYNSNPAATTLGYTNQNSYNATGPINHPLCNLNQSFLYDTSGGTAHIDTVRMFNSLAIWGASTIGTLTHYDAKSNSGNTGVTLEYGFKVTGLHGATCWGFYSDAATIPSYSAGQFKFGGTVGAPGGSLNADGSIDSTAVRVNGAPINVNTPSYGVNTFPYTIPINQKFSNLFVYPSANAVVYLDNFTTHGDYVTIINTSPYTVTVGFSGTNWRMAGANGSPNYQIPVVVNANRSMMFILPSMSSYGETRAINLGPHAMADHTDYSPAPAATQKVGQLYWDAFSARGYAPVAITGAADNGSGLIRITSPAHGLSTSNAVIINGVGGVTNANGAWIVTVIDVNTYDLVSSTFAGTYASGGTGVHAKSYGAGGVATNSFGDPAYFTMSLANGTIQVLQAGNYRITVVGEVVFLSNSGTWHYTCMNGVAIPGGNRYLLNSAAAYGSQSFAIDRIITCNANDTLTLIVDCETAGTNNYPARLTFSATKLS